MATGSTRWSSDFEDPSLTKPEQAEIVQNLDSATVRPENIVGEWLLTIRSCEHRAILHPMSKVYLRLQLQDTFDHGMVRLTRYIPYSTCVAGNENVENVGCQG